VAGVGGSTRAPRRLSRRGVTIGLTLRVAAWSSDGLPIPASLPRGTPLAATGEECPVDGALRFALAADQAGRVHNRATSLMLL
jgi:hypothetical protein